MATQAVPIQGSAGQSDRAREAGVACRLQDAAIHLDQTI